MSVLYLLRMLIAPEFTWVKIRDPRHDIELAQGFADDLMDGSALVLQKFDVSSLFISGRGLTVNVTRKE